MGGPLELDVVVPTADDTGTPIPRTVEDAVLAVSAARLFRTHDAGLCHGSAARIKASVQLDQPTRAKLWRTLAEYRPELERLGIDYAAIIVPAGGDPAPPPKPLNVGRSRVWVADGHLWLKSPWEAKDVVQTLVPSATWDKAVKAHKLPLTPSAALSVLDALGEYGVSGDEASGDLLRLGYEVRGATRFRTAAELDPIPGSKTKPWLHQLQAYHFASRLPGTQLDMEMGTGKSKVVVDVLGASSASRVMIVCPERVIGVWPKQFSIHSGREVHVVDPRRQNKRGEWLLRPMAERVDTYDEVLNGCSCGLMHVILTNYAASTHEPFKSWSLRQRLDYVVYDESHRLRSPDGSWSKWASKMRARSERRIGGTGTLQSQTPLDVFGQFRALDPGVFGENFTLHKRRYALLGGFQGKAFKAMNPSTEAEFAEKVASITYQVGAEVLDLPPVLPDETVVGHLSPRARRIYDEVEEDLFSEIVRILGDGTATADEISVPNVLVKMLRLQQVTGGNLQLDSGVLEHIDSAKEKLLEDLLEDLPGREPVVVFCRFRPDLDAVARVAAALRRPYHELSGRRSDALAGDGTLHEDAVIAGVQMQAGGAGVDFTRSAFAVYFSVGHSLGDYLQTRKRLVRPGQTRSVRLRHLVMEGTIDEDVYEALAGRQSVVSRVADRVRALQARGLS